MFTSICNFLCSNDNDNIVPVNEIVEKPDPKLLISISKNQMNTDSFFLPFMEKHNLVIHFVHMGNFQCF